MESISEVIEKKQNKSLLTFLQLCDPERKYSFNNTLIDAWNRLALKEQRKLYLYLLYRKWRGIEIFGDPYYIITNCHPSPFNWNGYSGISTLIKMNKIVIAKYNGSYGAYTADEARVWEMEDIRPLTY